MITRDFFIGFVKRNREENADGKGDLELQHDHLHGRDVDERRAFGQEISLHLLQNGVQVEIGGHEAGNDHGEDGNELFLQPFCYISYFLHNTRHLYHLLLS
jgi:hypothetical protein